MQPSGRSHTSQPPEKATAEFTPIDKAIGETLSPRTDVHMPSWDSAPHELSLHDRVVLSVVAISFHQSDAAGSLELYTSSLSAEIKNSFADRAGHIVDRYNMEIAATARGEQSETMWIDAAKWGIGTKLEDFALSQRDEFRSLSNFVREKTSWHSQVVLGIVVAFALAALVGLAKNAVTWPDDLSHSSPSKLAAKK